MVEPRLDITAAKGVLGLQITYRESETLTRCDVTLHERGRGDEWSAAIPGSLAPMETASLRWSQFEASGHMMPAYIRHDAKYFTVSCLGVDQKRRNAGLAF